MTRTQWRRHQRKKKAEREDFATKCEALVAKRDMAMSKTEKKPYTRKLSDENKNVANLRLSMRVAHLEKDGFWGKGENDSQVR